MESRCVDTPEQAQLIRAALKKHFPGVAFSVRSSRYSGGSSISVRWTDGPTQRAVEAIADTYEGPRFDGMTDLAYSSEHYLMPDGSAIFARDVGGYDHRERQGPAPEGAELVHFPGWVHCSRSLSLGFMLDLLTELAEFLGEPIAELMRDGKPHPSRLLNVNVWMRETDPGAPGELYRTDEQVWTDNLVWRMSCYRSPKPLASL